MFFLSWKQLMARKKQNLLILLGISFGTLLFVSISGVQLGMRRYIANQLLNNTAHILIKGEEKKVKADEVTEAFYPSNFVHWINNPSGLRENVKLENYSGWYSKLNQDSRVLGFSPRMAAHVVLNSGKFSTAVNLVGTIPEKQVKISSIEDYMKEGSFIGLRGSNTIVIGTGVADDLGLKTGQYVNVSSGLKEGPKSFKIAGIFQFGNQQIDRSLAFASLTDVQILTKSPGRVSEIAVALYDIDQAQRLADEWQILTHDKVEDWQEANASFMEMIKIQDFTRYFITISILLVASFGIYNVLSIMINQKKKEIAILRAIGYGPRRILELVLYQGLLLGVSGGILGMILGYLLCKYVESINLNFDIGNVNHLLISYDLSIYVTAFIVAIISSIISSYIPAKAASKMTPMDIIRAE